MSELDNHLVKLGKWTNTGKRGIESTVITTDTRTGSLVIALLAILASLGENPCLSIAHLIRVGAAHLWHLLAFAFHQWRANGRPSNGLFRQQQALLRTLPTPTSLTADYIRLWWSWRRISDHPMIDSLAPICLCLLCALGSITASISSSYVVSSSDLEVLVDSRFCGRINDTKAEWLGSYIAAVSSVARPYAEECYRNETMLPARCGRFVQPNIRFSVEKAACPFSPEMCVNPNDHDSPAIVMDSGLVDLNRGFGINLNDRNRMKYRRRTTCAILPTEGFATIIDPKTLPPNTTTDFFGEGFNEDHQYLLFHYGSRPWLSDWQNTTASMDLEKANATERHSLNTFIHNSAVKDGTNYFEPLPEMQRDDADITLLYIGMNDVTYKLPVDDPLFSAHRETVRGNSDLSQNASFYHPDKPFSVVGCTEQHQYCATSSSGQNCSKLDSWHPGLELAEELGLKVEMQPAVLQLFVDTAWSFGIFNNGDLNISSKISPSVGDIYSQIPDDQWITEIVGWESFVWASFQTVIADYAIGPIVRDPQATPYWIQPVDVGQKQLCASQRMRKTGGFVNINMFGLVFIITVSCVIFIIDLSLLKFLIFLSRFRKALAPRLDRWIQDGVLQLQRRAYEARGEGTWTDLNQDVPLTKPKENLTDLSVESLPAQIHQRRGDVSSATSVVETLSLESLPEQTHRHNGDMSPSTSVVETISQLSHLDAADEIALQHADPAVVRRQT